MALKRNLIRSARHLLTVLALGTAAAANAQAQRCNIPGNVPRPRPDLPSASEPVRQLPIGSYTLALSWAPEYCQSHGRDPAAAMQCGSGNRFGFVLHGLWPDGIGKEWPQYCAATPILPTALIKQQLCATPSAQLVQHEWAKHGTCTGFSPDAYFAKSTGLYGALKFPDMDALSRRPLTAGGFADALAAVNPGLPATSIRVTANRKGWLSELWLCLDKQFAYTRCRAGSGGVAANTALRIWRGRR